MADPCKSCQGTGEMRGYGGPAEPCPKCRTPTAEYDPKMIEALAVAIAGGVDLFDLYAPSQKESWRSEVHAALSALPLTPEALNAIWWGDAVAVPKNPAVMKVPEVLKTCWPDVLAASPYTKKE